MHFFILTKNGVLTLFFKLQIISDNYVLFSLHEHEHIWKHIGSFDWNAAMVQLLQEDELPWCMCTLSLSVPLSTPVHWQGSGHARQQPRHLMSEDWRGKAATKRQDLAKEISENYREPSWTQLGPRAPAAPRCARAGVHLSQAVQCPCSAPGVHVHRTMLTKVLHENLYFLKTAAV